MPNGHSSATYRLFRLCRAGDLDAREALITSYMPLARRLARKYSRSSIPQEDLSQVASLALVKAVDRFDPDRGRPFEAYATPTILGELRRFFRDTTWAVHVSRGEQECSLAVQEAVELLSHEHGRSPTVQQLAQFLELSEEEVCDALQVAQAYSATSLDAPAKSGEEESEATIGSEIGDLDPAYEAVERSMLIGQLSAGLGEREQLLLRLRFDGDMTQSQIAERIGVSQMQVSRLLHAEFAKLRAKIGDDVPV